jgi:hypothetical protein
MKLLKAVGKVILAIILGYAGLMVASIVGGFLAGSLGTILRLNATTIGSLTWTLPKVLFLGTLILIYIGSKRKRRAVRSRGSECDGHLQKPEL